MRYIKTISIIIFFFAVTSVISAQTVIPTDSVTNYMGKEVSVKGVITQVTILRSGITYLNMDGKYPDNKFTGVIFKKDADSFADIKNYEGKNVELSGIIEEYKGKPQIVLKKPEQIKVIE